jgi:hypothetical protein
VSGASIRERVCPRCGARYDAKAVYCQVDGSTLEEESDLFVGTTFDGRYRVDARLGEGGMGVVYRAFDRELGAHVALKVLHPQLSVQADAKRRFRREARLAMELEHPNLVRVLGFGATPEGTPYLVMELLEGETLASKLRPGVAFSVDEALELMRPVCLAVEAAHARGIVHRDLKPENVFLARDERGRETVKVLDFGIARLLDDDETFATRTGLIFGTARYISPEGARGEPTDERSDVYSLAVLTYQLLIGRLPFEASQSMALLVAHAKEAPPDLASHEAARAVPKPLVRAVMAALDKRPSRRPATAGAYFESLQSSGAPRSFASRLPRTAIVVTAFTLGFLVVGTTGFAVKKRDRDEQREAIFVLLELARSAEAQGRVGGPDGVLAITERLLAISPSQIEAHRMRERALASAAAEPVAEPPRVLRGSLRLATERPRVGRPLRVEVELEGPATDRRVVVELERGGEIRELDVELDRSARSGEASHRPDARGEHVLRLRIDGDAVGEPLVFDVEAAPRAAEPPVTTIVAPRSTTRPSTAPSGRIDWSPPP